MIDKKSTRQSRVACEIKKVLSGYMIDNQIVDDIDSRLIVVTSVVISACLQNAKVYISTVNNSVTPEECVEFLNKHAPKIRHHLGHSIKLKFVPSLHFFVDDLVEQELRVYELLKKHCSYQG